MRIYYMIIVAILFTASVPTNLQAQVEVSELTQQWQSNHWENSDELTNFIYNSNCQELYHLGETWDSSANNWDNSSQENKSYYNSGKLYQDSVQLWNTPDPGWNNNELATYTYDGSNYLINETGKSWNISTGSWQTSSQESYINNTDGTPHMAYILSLSGGVWDTAEILTYIYNTPGQLDTVLTTYPASSPASRLSYTYTTYTGYTIQVQLLQSWSTTSNSWQNYEMSIFIGYNNPVTNTDSLITVIWNNTTNAWDTSALHTFTYTPCTPTAVKQINPAGPLQVYPNPNAGNFTVTGLTQGQSVEIYNYTGQRIESRIADNTAIDFNITAYASGMYLVRVQNTDGSVAAQKTMVKTQ